MTPAQLMKIPHSMVSVFSSALVRAGATGAWAPVQMKQRVPGTRPQKGLKL